MPFGNALFTLIIMALSFPVHATQIPNYMIVNALGLINTLWALIIPKIAVAYNLFLMKQFCDQIPNSLLEAARIDGSGELRIFFKLVFPMLTPAWATLIVLSFVSNWNDYFSPLVFITDESRKTLPLVLTSLAENGNIARGRRGGGGHLPDGAAHHPHFRHHAAAGHRNHDLFRHQGIGGAICEFVNGP